MASLFAKTTFFYSAKRHFGIGNDAFIYTNNTVLQLFCNVDAALNILAEKISCKSIRRIPVGAASRPE